jgi:carboxyl-terminal processing protease
VVFLVRCKALILFNFVFFAFLTVAHSKNYPAVYQTSLGSISTVEQYKDRVTSEYPNLVHDFQEGQSIEYKGAELEAMVFKTNGIASGDKFDQTLTYGEISPGLWKLILLDAESCILRVVTIGNVTEERWICEEMWHPISGAFADVFLVDSDDLDLAVLSEAIGREVMPYTPEEPEEEQLITLEQLKEIITDLGASWTQEESVWTGFGGQGPEQPAISITVTGEPSDRINFNQTFLYFYKDDQMILGQISGQVCEFIDRVNSYICEDAFNPTQYAPFPYVLATSAETEAPGSAVNHENGDEEEVQSLRLSCGFLDQNYSSLLRFHFERGPFELYEIEGFRKALSKLAEIIDPENLLLSERDREVFERINKPPYLFADQVDQLATAIRLGLNGECGVLVDLTEDLFVNLQDSTEKVREFLSKVERDGFNSSAILTDQFDLQLWSWVLEKASELSFFQTAKSAAIDVALGQLRLYLGDAINFSEDLELLMTAAFFKEDAYSHMIKERDFLAFTQTQSSQGPYFGMSVIKGLKAHYIFSLHPETQDTYGLLPGDEIIEINGQPAALLSAQEVDGLLLDTDSVLDLNVRRGEEQVLAQLEASYLDLVQMSYSLRPSTNNQVFVLELYNFSIGLVDRLTAFLRSAVEQGEIKGLVVDLTKNQGGDSEEARRFLSMFIEKGPLFHYKIGSRASLIQPDSLEPSSEFFVSSTLPLVVLISQKTMSAAEIVASSLKDHKRALLVGGRTFGKFVGQRVFPVSLSNQTQVGLNVTVAEFFSPSGAALNGVGVEPDIITFESGPAFQDGNSPGVDIADINFHPEAINFVNSLDLQALSALSQDQNTQVSSLTIALTAMD